MEKRLVREILRRFRGPMGDLFAMLFVGFSLYLGYTVLHDAGRWVPIGIGFVVPMGVYGFSTAWNHRLFRWSRGVRLSAGMGFFFLVAHHDALPMWVQTAAGFAAPFFVSLWSRKQP